MGEKRYGYSNKADSIEVEIRRESDNELLTSPGEDHEDYDEDTRYYYVTSVQLVACSGSILLIVAFVDSENDVHVYTNIVGQVAKGKYIVYEDEHGYYVED